MEAVIQGKLSLLTKERWIVVLNPAGPECAKKNQRVGGCIWLIRGPLITIFRGIVKDKTGLGIVTALKFIIEDHPVLAVGAYWAIKPREEMSGLWGKVLSVLKRDGLHGSPLAYVQNLVSRLVQEHALKYGGVSTELVVGDLNTNRRNETGGSHSGFEEWLAGTGLSDEIGEDDGLRGSVLKTFWQVESEVSRIDHVLISSGTASQIVQYGVSKSVMWVGITDHRPIWASILIDTKIKFRKRVAKVYEQPTNMPKLVKPADKLKYQQDMSRFNLTLGKPETLDEASYQLETIYLKSVSVMKNIFPKNTPKNLGQNWSTPSMALKCQLLFLTLVRRVIVNCKTNNRNMRRHIKHHVAKWTRSVAKLRFKNDDERFRVMRWTGRGREYWLALEDITYVKILGAVSRDLLQVLNLMHTSKKEDDSRGWSDHKDRMIKCLKQKKVGVVIRSVLRKTKAPLTIDYIKKDGHFSAEYKAIYQEITDFFGNEWFVGKPEQMQGIHDPSSEWEQTMRDELLFLEATAHHGVPPALVKCLL